MAKKDRRRSRTGVIVLGMHRSGTSALTRVLGQLGCDLPKTLMGANKTNETGHWESEPIYRLNDRMLESAGSSWDDWLPLESDWFRSPKVEEFKAEAGELLTKEFGESSFFVLKDPRNCRLLPFWLDVFADADIEPIIMGITRNPLEVAASLKARNGFDPSFGHLLWLRHVLDAEAGSRGLRRCFTTYDELMSDWVGMADRARKTLGLTWPRSPAAVADDVEAFLAPRLRHHKEPAESVAQDPRLFPWLKDSFEILARWAGKGEVSSDHGTLDGLRAEFDTAAPAFSRLISSNRKALAQYGREAEKNAAELSAAREELRQARASEASEAKASAKELRDRLAVTESALAQRSLETEETAAELSAAREELRELRKALSTDQKIATGLKEHVDLLLADLKERAAAHSVLETMGGDFKRERDEALAAEQKAAEARAAFETAQKEMTARLDRQNAELAGLKGELGEARAAAEKARAESAAAFSKVEADAAKARAENAAELEEAKSSQTVLEERLKTRFDEIAALTRMMAETEHEAKMSRTDTDRVRHEAAKEMGRAVKTMLDGHGLRLMPGRFRIRRQAEVLKRSGPVRRAVVSAALSGRGCERRRSGPALPALWGRRRPRAERYSGRRAEIIRARRPAIRLPPHVRPCPPRDIHETLRWGERSSRIDHGQGNRTRS